MLQFAALAILHALAGQPAAHCAPVRIGADARLPDNPRSHYSRYVNWRPADGEVSAPAGLCVLRGLCARQPRRRGRKPRPTPVAQQVTREVSA